MYFSFRLQKYDVRVRENETASKFLHNQIQRTLLPGVSYTWLIACEYL